MLFASATPTPALMLRFFRVLPAPSPFLGLLGFLPSFPLVLLVPLAPLVLLVPLIPLVPACSRQSYGKPVMVCCETYKFCERVQLDSICWNELADPDDLVQVPRRMARGAASDASAEAAGEGLGKTEMPLEHWRDADKLKLLNLVYDLTPESFITMVITEVGKIPATSVPVIIREYHARDAKEARQ